MSVIWIPNVSEGRDPGTLETLVEAVTSAGVRVLDVHIDPVHNRSVITATGEAEQLVLAAASLAGSAATAIDLQTQTGTHPRLGALDVSPFVPHDDDMRVAIDAARAAAHAIYDRTGIPVYLYGEAAEREETRELPDLRKGGLAALVRRAEAGLPPDVGSPRIDPGRGVVCVGARGPLIAFNVWIEAPVEVARAIARAIRGPAVRALGMDMGGGVAQVSMNLIDPARTGIDEVYGRVAAEAASAGAAIASTELVGLVSARFLPNPNAEAARLLREPGRSLESELAGS
jgi:glutamate formiminotransferase